MRLAATFRILGILAMLFSLTLLVPCLVSLFYGDNQHRIFMQAFGLVLLSGVVIWLPTALAPRTELSVRDGFLVTSLFWIVLGLFGALPFLLSESVELSYIDAVFESVSGLTTTGATVITGLDELPRSLLFYRQLLQWLGGIGIVVIAVAVLPLLGVGGMQLFRAETPGPVKDAKMTPRIAQTAKALFSLYITLTALCALCYWLAGMDPFNAICHAFSTISIGGFSTHDASLAYYDATPMVGVVASVFMFVAALNFAHHYYCWSSRRIRHYYRDPETVFYAQVMIGVIVLTTVMLLWHGHYDDWRNAAYHAVLQAVSITTTTGFASTDFAGWPSFLPVLLILCSFIGGCIGSTGGGIKAVRVLLILRQGLRELAQLIHPNAIIPLKLGKKRVPAAVVSAVWSFFAVYVATFMVILLGIMATGLEFTSAFSATAAALNNLGPGLGEVAQTYQDVSGAGKAILCAAMLLGRLEIFTLLVLFMPMFWRH